MYPQISEIGIAIDQVLSPVGFKKHRATWTKVLPEVRQFVAIDAGPQTANHWLEFGINVRKVCDEPRTPVYRLHLRWRATQLMGSVRQVAHI